MTASKDDVPTADQAAITKIAGLMLFSGGGGLIQTTTGCSQQRMCGSSDEDGGNGPVRRYAHGGDRFLRPGRYGVDRA